RWFFRAPPGAAIVGIRADARFETNNSRWQVGLSNGSTLLKGCWAQRRSSGGLCGDYMGLDEYVPFPGSPVIYTEAYCVYGPCPASYTSAGPGHVYARAIVSS